MSSLITKQPKDTRKQTTVSLSGTVLADLELYCRFIESGRDWVINESLRNVFRRDKAFLEWKERNGSSVAIGSGGEDAVEAAVPIAQSPSRRPKSQKPVEGPGSAA
ncbi:MAG TPA: hypothetical protein VG675_05050 [Bryobacteraceae bacterium]|nr:hypothetical protein [Bryobacteraceae bacterium]